MRVRVYCCTWHKCTRSLCAGTLDLLTRALTEGDAAAWSTPHHQALGLGNAPEL